MPAHTMPPPIRIVAYLASVLAFQLPMIRTKQKTNGEANGREGGRANEDDAVLSILSGSRERQRASNIRLETGCKTCFAAVSAYPGCQSAGGWTLAARTAIMARAAAAQV
jgi:hypothetical protein